MKYLELKEELKKLAKEIKVMKGKRKKPFCEYSSGFVPGLLGAQYRFRHHHIAYCMLRGTSRDQIERPADNNRPNEAYISEIMAKIEPREVANEEAICCG